ncbi:MAG TPA: NifU family protein [Candidatus Baltobacteraceae bacterium]|nr:NifU family protein [Candidatus Baltobacteraceae bacterium]
MGRRGLDGVAHARRDEGIRAITQTIEERVNAALDKVRPGIAADGGEVWLIKVEGGIAYVQMLGACGGCPASTMTLKGAIETIVRADVPEIAEVVEI